MDLVRAIVDVVGIEASDRGPDRVAYARDLWPRHHIGVREGRVAPARPAAIAWPETTEHVSALVRLCAQEKVSIVPFGAGSGVCGAVLPTPQTLVVDLKKMKRWRRFAPEEGYLEVEAGALGIRLEEDLGAEGYTVGHFPSSILCSTVGGWIAARGAGQCSGRYGKIEDMVASIEHVDGRGEVATLYRRGRGPDLTPLIIGSEGIYGIVTAARLRLHPAPERRTFGAFSFKTMQSGWEAVRELYQAGLRPAVCRLYDPFDTLLAKRKKAEGRSHDGKAKFTLGGFAIRQLLRFPGPLNAALEELGERIGGGAMLVLVFEGTSRRSEEELEAARRLLLRRAAEDLGEGPARHWLDRRYGVSYRQAPMIMMGTFVDTMEVAAPWSRLGALYDGVRRALGDHVMVMAHMSHAYPDGCSIYFTFAGQAKRAEEAERLYDAAWTAALAAAIEAGGTLSHHHGVGRSKAPAMGPELGLGVEVVRALREAFDPQGILNPGNLIPDEAPPARPAPKLPELPILDQASQTVHARGDHSLGAIESLLEREGLSLSIDRAVSSEMTLDAWLAAGAPGAPDPWLDPVDHLVAGYTVALPTGAILEVRPCPRRAVGPDLFALFFGTEGKAGRFLAAHLRARAASACPLETPLVRERSLGGSEGRWLERCIDAAARVPPG